MLSSRRFPELSRQPRDHTGSHEPAAALWCSERCDFLPTRRKRPSGHPTHSGHRPALGQAAHLLPKPRERAVASRVLQEARDTDNKMTDIVQPPRSKRARRTKTLETWLKGRGVDEPEALREACLYASTIDELATAPPEDMDWLTEAWDPRVRSVFLDAVNEARTAIEQGRKARGRPG